MRPNLNKVQVNLWPLGVLLLAAALALAVIACGGDEEEAPTTSATAGTAGQTAGTRWPGCRGNASGCLADLVRPSFGSGQHAPSDRGRGENFRTARRYQH